MTTRTHLFVACTNRKSLAPDPRLRLDQAYDTGAQSSLAEHVTAWATRLDSVDSQTCPASDLYLGEQWSVVRALRERRPDVTVWICSAGYGLVDCESALKSYSATFAPDQPDSVRMVVARATDGGRNSDWWAHLAMWPGPTPGAPRLISEVVRSRRRSRFVVALSQPYIDACSVDLMDAAQNVRPEHMVIAAAQSLPDGLSRFHVPASGALRTVLRGTVGTVVTRLADALIEAGATDVPAARAFVEDLTDRAGPLPRYERKRDPGGEEVAHFIRGRLLNGSGPSASALLREFRSKGRACEQQRFHRIYRSITEGDHRG